MSALGHFHVLKANALGAAVLVLPLIMSAGPANCATQVLTGGNSTGAAFFRYTSPGHGNQYPPDFPGPGQGEKTVQIPLPAGTLRGLQVHVETENVPASGKLTLIVRINRAGTILRCSVNGTGSCKTKKSKTVAVSKNDRMSVLVKSDFVNPGGATYSYLVLFDTP